MKCIFLDFDGVINIFTYDTKEKVIERVKILSEMCRRYNCKVVIESSHKDSINEETLETDVEWIKELFELFKEYGIEVIGRTPVIGKTINKGKEILAYLEKHPEIEYFCVIDDDDLVRFKDLKIGNYSNSDLNEVREHLVTTVECGDKPQVTGLLEKHIEEVGKKLQKRYHK